MLLGTCLAFGLFGYFTGRDEDRVLLKNRLLKDETLTDPLTGLGNHRFLHDVLKVEFRRHLETSRPLTCLMMDLDRFKGVNDTFGHPFGDKVLRAFASIIRRSIREGDVAARYGGEEFLCVLPDCDREQARRVAERIRTATEGHPFHHGRRRVRVTVSVGVVTSYESGGLNYRHLINLADRALYEAKHQGRNQVVQTTLKPSQ
jgi:two-component system cell cycle response regulator